MNLKMSIICLLERICGCAEMFFAHLEAVQWNHTKPASTQTLTHFILTLCREAVATGDLGLSGLTAVEGGTLLLQHWSCGAVDRSVH